MSISSNFNTKNTIVIGKIDTAKNSLKIGVLRDEDVNTPVAFTPVISRYIAVIRPSFFEDAVILNLTGLKQDFGAALSLFDVWKSGTYPTNSTDIVRVCYLSEINYEYQKYMDTWRWEQFLTRYVERYGKISRSTHTGAALAQVPELNDDRFLRD
jgi:hypothetical protein